MDNIESQFNSIVEELDMEDFSDPRGIVTSWQVNRAILGMNHAGTKLGQVLGTVLNGETAYLPEGMSNLLKEVIQVTDKLVEALSECKCADCQLEDCPNCIESESGVCDACMEYAEEDDEE